jgi:hypothetical protein
MIPRASNLKSRSRVLVASAAGLACALALVVTPASAATDDSGRRDGALPRITGKVGPGYHLSFGQESVPAGTYKLIIVDRSTIHNFHLTGPGIDRATKVSFRGKVKWRVTLVEGVYTGECDPHSSMDDVLTVT